MTTKYKCALVSFNKFRTPLGLCDVYNDILGNALTNCSLQTKLLQIS